MTRERVAVAVWRCTNCPLHERYDYERNGWWVRHGDNPEHRRFFPDLDLIQAERPKIYALHPAWDFFSFEWRRDVFEWLEECHGIRAYVEAQPNA